MHEQAREGSPWLAADAFPRVLSGSAELCPALRLLPPVGTFLGESFASAALLFRTPLQIIANPFAVMEVLASRGVGCPANVLAHNALGDCGAALFSLDDFYDSVSAASGAFWDIWAFVAYLVSDYDATGLSRSLLSGGVSYVGASRTVSLLRVTHTLDGIGGGAGLQRYLSRRLLAAKAPAANSEDEGGAEEEDSGGGGWTSTFSRILSIATDMVSGIGDIASMQMARGAKMGMLLSPRDPTHLLGHWCAAPVSAWSRFMYGVGVETGLDLASTAYQGISSLSVDERCGGSLTLIMRRQ